MIPGVLAIGWLPFPRSMIRFQYLGVFDHGIGVGSEREE